jgi:hypothetical protein
VADFKSSDIFWRKSREKGTKWQDCWSDRVRNQYLSAVKPGHIDSTEECTTEESGFGFQLSTGFYFATGCGSPKLLRIFERIVLRLMYSPANDNGVYRTRYNSELYTLYGEPDVIKVV